MWNAITEGTAHLEWLIDPIFTLSQLKKGDSNWEKSIYSYHRKADCKNCDLTVLMVVIRMERKFTSYAVQTIMPSMMMVIVSFCSLAIPPDQVRA